jgi:hypothetical protein
MPRAGQTDLREYRIQALLKELITMSDSRKQLFLKLMRMEKIQISADCREQLAGTSAKELLSSLSFPEFSRLIDEVRMNEAEISRN